jgi:ribonucleoside-triphosphate reductase (formate)
VILIDNHSFEDLIVVKRSGQRVEFNSLKIAVAIKNAFDSTPSNYSNNDINKVYDDTLSYIYNNYKDRKTINVEDIQDVIELTLKKDSYNDIYDSFSGYRLRRSESRKSFSVKQQHKFVKAIEKIGCVDISNYKVGENLEKFGSIISSEYTKSYILDNKYVRAFEEGKIYIHNFLYFHLGYFSNTSLDIRKLADKDEFLFDILNILVRSKEEVKGEVSINGFDDILSKYYVDKFKKIFIKKLVDTLSLLGFIDLVNIKKIEDRIFKELSVVIILDNYRDLFVNDVLFNILENIYDMSIMEVFDYMLLNIKKILMLLNDSYRENNFYSISIGNNKTYEGNIIKNIILDLIDEMDYLENICIVYKVCELSDIDKIVKLIYEGKNMRLNILDKENNNNYDVEYFSDGTRIYENIYSDSISIGRMNVANTSINMARLGFIHKSLNKEFYKGLDNLIEFTKNELLIVYENMGNKIKNNYNYLFDGNIFDDEKLDYGQKIRKVIKNGTLNINLVGLYECALMIDKDKTREIMLKIIKYINKKIILLSIDNKLNFTLSAIVNDASYELMDLDKAIYGVIKGINDNDFYRNVMVDCSIEELNLYQKMFNGGCILEIKLKDKFSLEKIRESIIELVDNYVGIVYIKE